MDSERVGTRFRPRFGLRGIAVLLLIMAAGFAALRPFVREPVQRFERYLRVKRNEPDLYRHVDDGPGVAKKFAEALHAGDYANAWELTTASFRRRTGEREFSALAAQSPLSRQSSELIEGFLKFADDRGLYVSECVFQCGRDGERVTLVLVTESGRLKVDRIEREPSAETRTR